VCTGVFSVEVFPSPKDHFHEVGDPVPLPEKSTARGAFPEVRDAEKLGTGGFKTFETAT